MNKYFFTFVSLTVFFLVNICAAEISKEVSLGGIKIGMTYREVVAMYGEPTAKFDELTNKGKIWAKHIEYGNNVQITFSDENGEFGKVKNVLVIADNGWSLSSGIKVGSKKTDFVAIYGEGDSRGKGRYGEYKSVKISKNECIAYSIPDTGNSDKISSIQINNGSFQHTRLSDYPNSRIRYIK